VGGRIGKGKSESTARELNLCLDAGGLCRISLPTLGLKDLSEKCDFPLTFTRISSILTYGLGMPGRRTTLATELSVSVLRKYFPAAHIPSTSVYMLADHIVGLVALIGFQDMSGSGVGAQIGQLEPGDVLAFVLGKNRGRILIINYSTVPVYGAGESILGKAVCGAHPIGSRRSRVPSIVRRRVYGCVCGWGGGRIGVRRGEIRRVRQLVH
jgi:hypothetical protein